MTQQAAPDPSFLSSSSFGVEREQELSEQNQAALDLEALSKLAELATPGPWEVDGYMVFAQDDGWIADLEDTGNEDEEERSQDAHDTRFIAACRSAVPALIAEVARLKSALVTASRLALQEDPATKDNLPETFEYGFQWNGEDRVHCRPGIQKALETYAASGGQGAVMRRRTSEWEQVFPEAIR